MREALNPLPDVNKGHIGQIKSVFDPNSLANQVLYMGLLYQSMTEWYNIKV